MAGKHFRLDLVNFILVDRVFGKEEKTQRIMIAGTNSS
jgi:hypothetical protein